MVNPILIPQFEPWFDDEEANGVSNYLLSGGFLTEFKVTEQFENELSSFTGAKHAIMVNSGTSALITMLHASSVGPGDEIIVPNYTMIATPSAVRAVGATPVLVDIELETLSLDLEKTRDAITPRTKGIFLVLANGREPSPGIRAFEQLCAENGILLFEDAAQALGSSYSDGRAMGTVGVAGMISFSVPKIITTGQGGCVLTSDAEYAGRVRAAKDFGREQGGIDNHPLFGLNYKFTDLQAAVGIAQMKKLTLRVELKRKIYDEYREKLRAIPNVKVFQQNLEKTTPWFIDIAVPHRQELSDHLRQLGIGTRPMYPPVNSQPIYQTPGEFPNSTWVGQHGLWLPSSSQLKSEDIEIVVDAMTQFMS